MIPASLPEAPARAGAGASRWRKVAITVAALMLAAAMCFFARGPLLCGALRGAVALATGYDVRIGSADIELDRIALRNIHVTRRGDPVLDASEVDVDYVFRDLFPGGSRQYGLKAIDIVRPHLYVVRRTDGSYNISIPHGKASLARPSAVPLVMQAHLTDGMVEFIDPRNPDPDGRRAEIAGINAAAEVDTAAVTRYRVRGAVLDGGRSYPIRAQATIDAKRRYAMHRIQAAEIPLRGLGNFMIDSATAQIRSGSLRDLDVRLYALNVPKDGPVAYHLGGGARLNGIALNLDVLTRPVRDLGGAIAFDDDAIVSPKLTGRLGPTRIALAGGLYDFAKPQFRLGVVLSEDLRALHRDFAFLRKEDLSGPLSATTVLEGGLSRPLILASVHARRVAYGAIPVRDFRATIAYHDGVIFTGDVAGTVGNVRSHVAARFLTGGRDVDAMMALTADAPPGAMPYLDRIAPHAASRLTIVGSGIGFLLDAHGVFSAKGGGESASTLFSLSPRGVGELGPFAVTQPRGSLHGGFVIDRERGTSAMWIDARNLKLTSPSAAAQLSGVKLPDFPPIAGRFDGKMAGVDIDRRLVLFGSGAARNAEFAGVPIQDARADLAGPVDGMALGGVVARGEFGRFAGRGALGERSFAFVGKLDGTLQGMRRWTGDLGASGHVHGPIAVVSNDGRTLVQTSGVGLVDAAVHGIPLLHLAGTFAVDPSRVVVYGATADLAGGSVVARGDSKDGIRLSTSGIDAARLRPGSPLRRGTIVGAGALRLQGRAPAFDGAFALAGGRVAGHAVDASAGISYDDNALRIDAGSAAAAGAFGFLDGTIDDVATHPRYDLRADLRYADLAKLAQIARLPLPYLSGSVEGIVHVAGAGLAPDVTGMIRVPEGSINGLDFGNAATTVAMDSHGIRARGDVTVGSTRTAFSGDMEGDDRRFTLDAPSANLADFNDFFPVAGTLSGHGDVHMMLTRSGGSTYSSGNIDLDELRFRRFAFGHATLNWSGQPGEIDGHLAVLGTGGALVASGRATIPHGTALRRLVAASNLNLSARLKGFDLAVWLPALGYTAPVLGHVDAVASIRGRYPRLALDFNGKLSDGMIGRIPIDRFTVSAAAAGGRSQVRSLDLSVAGVNVRGGGSFGIGPHDPIALDFDASSERLGEFVSRIFGSTYGIDGAGNIHVAVTGTPSNPSAQAALSLQPLRLYGLSIPSVVGNLSVDPQRIALRDATVSLPTGKVTITGSVPLVAGPLGIPPATPLSFDLGIAGVSLDQFGALAPPQTKLGGNVEGLVHVRGTIAQPTLVGNLDLTGGSYSGPLETQPVSGVAAHLAFNQTTASLTGLEATIGGGRLTGSGSLRLPGAAEVDGRPSYDAEFKLDGVRVAFPGYGATRLDGNLWLRRPAPEPGTVGGSLTLSDASIPLAAFVKAAASPPGGEAFVLPGLTAPGPSLAAAAFALPGWLESLGLDLDLTAGNNVRIVSPILNIGGRGNVRIAGQVGAPSLDGELRATPGGSLFLNRAFRLQEASVRFTPQNGIAPDLYARATTEIVPAAGLEPIDVTVTAQGLIPDVKLSYASNPPYDEATIVGLLFGANSLGATVGSLNTFAPSTNILLPPNAFQQTPAGTFALSQEAASLINAQFTARLLAPIEQGLGSAFGLSDLAINLSPVGTVGVQARRLLGRNVAALYGTSLSYPYRMTFGLESRPDSVTSVIFTAFTQQGLYSFGGVKPDAYLSANPLLGSAADLGGTQGFTVNVQRRFR